MDASACIQNGRNDFYCVRQVIVKDNKLLDMRRRRLEGYVTFDNN